mgnify:CR=1 FL=1
MVSFFIMILFGASLFTGNVLEGVMWYTFPSCFVIALLFGGIEEIGWRYTFQPILEEKINYILATIITFLSWGVWHLLYFYIDGSLSQIQVNYFMIGLFTNCFIFVHTIKKSAEQIPHSFFL